MLVLCVSLVWWMIATTLSATASPSPQDVTVTVLDRLDSLERLATVQEERFQREKQQWLSDKAALGVRMAELETGVYYLTTENEELKKDVEDMHQDRSLHDRLVVMGTQNHDVRDRLVAMETENHDLKNRLVVLEKNVDQLQAENDKLKKGVQDKQQDYAILSAENRSLKSLMETLRASLPVMAPKQNTPQGLSSEFPAGKTAASADDKPAEGEHSDKHHPLLSPTESNSGDAEDLAVRSADVSVRSDDQGPLEVVVEHLSQQLTQVTADVQTLKDGDSLQDLAIQQARGSSFVRWGSSSCPDPGDLVYRGVVGGSYYTHTGAATNTLCLSLSPVLQDPPAGGGVSLTQLHGGEYETYDSHMQEDPSCAVCLSPLSITIMVPGTNACSSGWTLQYSGYLMAGHHTQQAGTQFICVDTALEGRLGSGDDHNGHLLYFTETVCGSLPCPPYVDHKIVTCAVCSK